MDMTTTLRTQPTGKRAQLCRRCHGAGRLPGPIVKQRWFQSGTWCYTGKRYATTHICTECNGTGKNPLIEVVA